MNKTIIATVLLLVGLPTGMAAPAFGQVAQLPDTTIPTQCIDLNQDKICEAVILVNGTMLNFTKPTPIQIPEEQTTGKCQGFQKTPTFCKNLLMPSGEIVLNKTWTYGCNAGFYQTASVCVENPVSSPEPAIETQTQTAGSGDTTTTWTDPKTGLVYDDIPTQGYYCLDFDEDSICDVDFTNGKMVFYGESETDQKTTATTTADEPAVGERSNDDDDNNNDGRSEDNDALPYCDRFESGDWPDSGCHDRRDYYDGGSKDGLYPCNDGTDKKDWRDCKDASGYDYDNDDEGRYTGECKGQQAPQYPDYCSDPNDVEDDNDDTGGSNPDGEEEDQSCGGESCSDDEKEDSTTDEDVGGDDE